MADIAMERRGWFSRVRGKRLSQRAKEELVGYLCISPWLIGFLIFTAAAMGFSFALGFFDTDLLTYHHFVGLRNYASLPGDKLFRKSLMVTAYYTFGAVPLSTVLALFVALLLNQEIPGRGIWRTIYYLPSVVSGVAVALLWLWMFNPNYGIINALLARVGIEGPTWIYSETWAMPAFIIMSLWGVGGNMLLYLAGLQGIPTPLYDAAKIDGAGSVRCFWHVTIPMLTPTIFFNLIMNVIGSFQVFTSAYVMTNGGPNNATLTFVLYLYRKAFQQFRFGYASALAWVLFFIVLGLSLAVIKSSAWWVYYAGELRK